MAASSVVTAQQYVFMYKDGNTCNFLSRNGSNIQNTTTFNASSCVWNKVSGKQQYTSGSYYLRPRTSNSTESLNLSTSSSYATWSAVSNGKLCDYYQTSYCLRFNGTNWENDNTNSNNVVVYQYSAEEALFNVSTISGDASITSTSGSHQYTSSATYRPNYVTLAGVNTFYLVDGVAQTTAPTSLNSGITYAWTLSNNMSGYASVSNTGVVTYSTLIPEASRTATLTCTATHTASGATKEATYTITFTNPNVIQEPVISYTMVSEGLQVTLTHPTTGVTIYYTTDGSDPRTSTTKATYSAPFNVANNTTIKAYAVKDSKTSPVASTLAQMSSGIVGDAVILYDYEDHNWSYYKGVDSDQDPTIDGNYNTKYLNYLYSPNPRNVKITYKGGSVANASSVAISGADGEGQNEMVYYITLEKTVVGETGDYPYTVISNPFSKRPRLTSATGTNGYYGFAGWKVTKGWSYIKRANGSTATQNAVLNLDEKIHFQNLPYESVNCTSAEIEFEATWTSATVVTSKPTSNQGDYEHVFWIISGGVNPGTVSYPCTIMGRNPDGTAGNYSSSYLSGAVTAGCDGVKVEWVRMNTTGTHNANGNDFTLGRGIVNTGTSKSNIYCSNSNQECTHTVKIESGYYNNLRHFNAEISATNTINQIMYLGCDYDRAHAVDATSYNQKLDIVNMRMYGGSGRNVPSINRAAGQLYARCFVKSGTFCSGADATEDQFEGGGGDENYYFHRYQEAGRRMLTVEGGHFMGGITCGSDNINTQPNSIAVNLRVRGTAEVEGMINGAASSQNSSGHRIFVFTGGKIRGWIAAGSNGTQAANGITNGASYVYIGGNTEVNSDLFHPGTHNMLGHSTGGVVYGTGCGTKTSSTSGQMTQGTNVVLADNAYVERGVYGGGALGYVPDGNAAGTDTDPYYARGTSNIYILGGHVGGLEGKVRNEDMTDYITVKGGVYGGACYRGGGNANIYMLGGLVEGGIYGGSNANGTLTGNTNIVVNGGQVGLNATHYNVHGGGYGSPTRVLGSVNVTVGKQNATTGATIYGDVYGGSAEGKTNGNTDRTNNTVVTNVTLNAGTINGSLYGGGLGSSSYAADVYGPVTVTVNGGEVTNVFGCNNANGEPKDTVSVIINGTKATVINSGDTTYAIKGVYGGGNVSDYYSYAKAPAVVVNNCATSIEDVYGGGNAAAVPATNVTINGGDINRVFGGGNGASGDPAHVGRRTSTTTTVGNGNVLVNINGGTINQVFGGSNKTGIIKGTSTINVGATSSSCSMDVKSLFAGGNEAASNGGTLNVSCGAKLGDVYGGANKADIGTSTNPANINLTINGGNIHRVFGGNNASGTIYGKITVNINVTGTCGDTIGYVYGGGNQAPYTAPSATPNYPEVNVIKGHIIHDVYGGGLGLKTDATKGTITGNPQVKIYKGQVRIDGNVFGGGNAGKVFGNTNVQVGVTE